MAGARVLTAQAVERMKADPAKRQEVADAVTPGLVTEGARAMWQLGQVQVRDGGSDGVASTSGNTSFAVQGIFVP